MFLRAGMWERSVAISSSLSALLSSSSGSVKVPSLCDQFCSLSSRSNPIPTFESVRGHSVNFTVDGISPPSFLKLAGSKNISIFRGYSKNIYNRQYDQFSTFPKRFFSMDSVKPPSENPGDKNLAEKSGNGNPPSETLTLTIKNGLSTRESATNFLGQLTDHQKQLLYHTLNVEILGDNYEGNLGSSRIESHHFLSKFGRLTIATEDFTRVSSEISSKILKDQNVPPASASAIWAVLVKNALPFVGFGFLDNIIMILAGDYIDLTIGAALGISTMAAAALGNTISDVAGIGSAWYVEAMASKIGIKDPDLTPSQMASSSVRWACNLGRAFGVAIGCLLGMFPLLFFPSAEEKELLKSKVNEDGDAKKKSEADPKTKP
ncbi:unnamed protein product [Orchesella dallaii]|uniref:Transmembrane protein 65 n=1 Tax=Orchesella dallaii TaxID=48710 RepID=A0ABP1RQ86_9HEXA